MRHGLAAPAPGRAREAPREPDPGPRAATGRRSAANPGRRSHPCVRSGPLSRILGFVVVRHAPRRTAKRREACVGHIRPGRPPDIDEVVAVLRHNTQASHVDRAFRGLGALIRIDPGRSAARDASAAAVSSGRSGIARCPSGSFCPRATSLATMSGSSSRRVSVTTLGGTPANTSAAVPAPVLSASKSAHRRCARFTSRSSAASALLQSSKASSTASAASFAALTAVFWAAAGASIRSASSMALGCPVRLARRMWRRTARATFAGESVFESICAMCRGYPLRVRAAGTASWAGRRTHGIPACDLPGLSPTGTRSQGKPSFEPCLPASGLGDAAIRLRMR